MAKRKKKQHNLSHLLKGSALLACALFVGLSLLSYCNKDPSKNWLGLLGYVAGWSLNYLLGLPSFLLPVFCGWVGWQTLIHKDIPKFKIKLLLFGTGVISLSLLFTMVAYKSPGLASFFERWVHSDYFPRKESYNPASLRHYLGGVPLHHLYVDTSLNLRNFLGGVGSFLVFFASLVLSFVLLTELSIKDLFEKAKKKIRTVKPKFALMRPVRRRPFAPLEEERLPSVLVREDPLKKITRIKISEAKPSQKLSETKPVLIGDYELPSPSLLTEVTPIDQSFLKSDLKRQAEILEETLLSFSIEAKVGDIHCGPTITSFEVHPAVGVKVQKIKALESDIALNMEAKSIRIIAPIPGKAAVGIEVPNAKPQEVSFRELLESYRASSKKAQVPLLLGKLVNGENLWSDLTKIPHLIIAGATGAGKSVCINTIVMSIVMNARPDEIKLVMVDPKKVELTAYTHLPHMLAPVITEPGGACAALSWLVKEMERRYEMLRLLGIRNITGFNSRKPNKGLEESLDLEIPEKMPYIVVIIDELADLMMVAQSDIETPIARIAQMARAVGIHLILATQRPSREVITGLIKANFPSRIAFKVSSRINSQIIIDENGAELLLGNGDMLFMPPGSSSLCRTQGAFIRDDDINQVIHFCCSQASTNYLIPSFDNYRDINEGPVSESNAKRDPLYEDAKELVLGTGNASTTFLQRKMKVGYARAASLMDQLEENGIIGPSEGAKARKIYYPQEEETS